MKKEVVKDLSYYEAKYGRLSIVKMIRQRMDKSNLTIAREITKYYNGFNYGGDSQLTISPRTIGRIKQAIIADNNSKFIEAVKGKQKVSGLSKVNKYSLAYGEEVVKYILLHYPKSSTRTVKCGLIREYNKHLSERTIGRIFEYTTGYTKKLYLKFNSENKQFKKQFEEAMDTVNKQGIDVSAPDDNLEGYLKDLNNLRRVDVDEKVSQIEVVEQLLHTGLSILSKLKLEDTLTKVKNVITGKKRLDD